jgi:hypothetical protein
VHTKTHEVSVSLPTKPCSVVWSGGHCYVLEGPRWVGLDGHGRPLALRPADLKARGWTMRPS